MDEIINVENVITPVTGCNYNIKKEVIDTILNSYRQLSPKGQCIVLGVGLFTMAGLTAYALKHDFGFIKNENGWQLVKYPIQATN